MSVMSKSWNRHYEIDDRWLAAFASDQTAYVDIHEIRNSPQTSAYVQWLWAELGLEADDERQKATFITNGTHIGDDDGGKYLRFDAETDPIAVSNRQRNKFAAGITHPFRVRRIYAEGTTLRHIWIVGYSA